MHMSSGSPHRFLLILKLYTLIFALQNTVLTLVAQPDDPVIDDLREKADTALLLGNVSGRGQIDVVFKLADKLYEKGEEAESVKYLSAGLKLYPWSLDHQLTYAKILMKKGETTEGQEKAQLVRDYAEEDRLVIGALGLLKETPPNQQLPSLSKIAGDGYGVVIVPIGEVDLWLLKSLEKGLNSTLEIPVYIQSAGIGVPPSDRDQLQPIAQEIRAKLKPSLKNPQIQEVLKKNNLTEEALNDNAVLLDFYCKLLVSFGNADSAKTLSSLLEKASNSKQWLVGSLIKKLVAATEQHKREKIGYLGVTKKDIYSPDSNFLFGWGEAGRAVMSYCRFTANFNDETPNRKRLEKRALMQSLSSVGHIFKIARCSDPRCARAYPHSLTEHDAKEGTLCSACKKGFQAVFGGKTEPAK
jgi:predicted Zn-dependent protease